MWLSKMRFSAIMILLNAHMAMQHENGLAIYAAAGTGTAQLLYSTAPFSNKRQAQNRPVRRRLRAHTSQMQTRTSPSSWSTITWSKAFEIRAHPCLSVQEVRRKPSRRVQRTKQ